MDSATSRMRPQGGWKRYAAILVVILSLLIIGWALTIKPSGAGVDVHCEFLSGADLQKILPFRDVEIDPYSVYVVGYVSNPAPRTMIATVRLTLTGSTLRPKVIEFKTPRLAAGGVDVHPFLFHVKGSGGKSITKPDIKVEVLRATYR